MQRAIAPPFPELTPVSINVLNDIIAYYKFQKDDSHYVDLIEKQELLTNKNKRVNLYPYKDFNWCVDLLKKGIKATKISFNKPSNCKVVTIRLNSKLTHLSYAKQVD